MDRPPLQRVRGRAPFEHTLPPESALRARRRRAAALSAMLVAACAGAPEDGGEWPDETRREAARLEAVLRESARPPAAGALRVRLAFGEAADLDLYVTGPLQETVYFANESSRTGGRLDADRRCGAPAPRIETITFPEAPPGRYRAGVDYPEPCREDAGPVPFALAIEADGTARYTTGLIEPRRFAPIIEELEHPSGERGRW